MLIAQHRMPPTIMVMPAGRQSLLDGDTEWADAGAGRWMDFVVDVVHDVDHRFATYPDRRHRGLAGDSEGGYGATNIALHHLPMFSVFEAWSGYFTQTPTAAFSGATRGAAARQQPGRVRRLARAADPPPRPARVPVPGPHGADARALMQSFADAAPRRRRRRPARLLPRRARLAPVAAGAAADARDGRELVRALAARDE